METKAVARNRVGLEDFETEYAPTAPATFVWSVEKYQVAQLYAITGKSKKQISKELGLPLTFINKCFESNEFQKYMQELTLEAAKTLKAEKIMDLRKALAARRELAEDMGYENFSKKDTLDIMEALRKEIGEEKTEDSNYAKLLEKLVANTAPVQIINMPSGDNK